MEPTRKQGKRWAEGSRLHGLDGVLAPDVGGFVGGEVLPGDVDGYFAPKGGMASGLGRHRTEEGDSLQLLVAVEGVAADGGDGGGDEVVRDHLAVHESAFGDFLKAVGYDKMAHIAAVLEGIGAHLGDGVGHDDVDE